MNNTRHDDENYNGDGMVYRASSNHTSQSEGSNCDEYSFNYTPFIVLAAICVLMFWVMGRTRDNWPRGAVMPVSEDEKKTTQQTDLEKRDWLMQNLARCLMVVKEEDFRHISPESEVGNTEPVGHTCSSSSSDALDGDLKDDLNTDLERGAFLSKDIMVVSSFIDVTHEHDPLLLAIPRQQPDSPSPLPNTCNTHYPDCSVFRTVSNECSICLCSYVLSDSVVWSSNSECPHVFHRDCIFSWLMSKMRPKYRNNEIDCCRALPCPCCRRNFVVNNSDKKNDKHTNCLGENGEVEVEEQSNEDEESLQRTSSL